MHPSIFKLTLALAIAMSACCAAPGFAQEGDTPAPVAAAAPAPPAAAEPAAAVARAPALEPAQSSFQAKGPIYFQMSNFGPAGQRKRLRYVPRSMVAKASTGALIGGLAGIILRAPGDTVLAYSKEEFFGIPLDAKQAARLSNPLLGDLPAVVDQNIVELLAANTEPGPEKYKEPIYVRSGEWTLFYDELLSDSDNYYLSFKASFTKQEEGERQTMGHSPIQHGGYCGYKSELKPLSVWQANDYEAVVLEKKKIRDICLKNVIAELPAMLGLDPDSRIRSAKLSCKTGYTDCMAESDKSPDPAEHKKECRAEQKRCVSDDVKPLVDMTPLGQCKVTLLACRASVTEHFEATSAGGKPDRAEFKECGIEYKKCAVANKKPGIF
jgi:hypothetical protein